MIFSNASHKGLGRVLMQHGKVIAYASSQVKEYEIRYPTHDLESAVIDFVLKELETSLHGKRREDYMDHNDLK